MIRVFIWLAGPLRNLYKTSPSAKGEEVDLPEGSTVAQLLDHYNVPHDKVHLIVVNRKKAGPATRLKDGDEIRAIPLAAGG